MDSKQQQLALRPISTRSRAGGSAAGEVAAAMERSSLAAASSFRVYYSLRPGAVPFRWESTPGTPKSGTAAVSPAPAEMTVTAAHHHQLPPISPPPSYYHSSQLKKEGRRCRPRASCQAAVGLVKALLAALGIRRRSHRRPPAASLV